MLKSSLKLNMTLCLPHRLPMQTNPSLEPEGTQISSGSYFKEKLSIALPAFPRNQRGYYKRLWSVGITSQDTPQFIAYGTKDSMVGMDETLNYIRRAKEAGCHVTAVGAAGQNHGFAQSFYMEQYLPWLKERFN